MPQRLRSLERTSVIVVAFLLATHLAARAQGTVTLDPGFGTNGVLRAGYVSYSDYPYTLLVQPDGKILTAGSSDGPAGYFVMMTRHFADGRLDSVGFGTGGKVQVHFASRDHAYTAALQTDGKIVAGGHQAVSNGASDVTPSVYRFNPDGSVDTAFAARGVRALRWAAGATGIVVGVTVLPDGRIVAAGRSNVSPHGFGAMRLKPSGELDSTFGSNGRATIATSMAYGPAACQFLPDQRILLASVFTNSTSGRNEYILCRFDSSGRADTSFGQTGVVRTGLQTRSITHGQVSLAGGPNGTFLMGACTPGIGGQATIFRFLGSGVLDTTFGARGRADFDFSGETDDCHGLAVDRNGKIILVGRASLDNGVAAIARATADGRPDTTFGPGGMRTFNLRPGATHYFNRAWIHPDGRILTVGYDFASNSGDFMLAQLRFGTTGAGEGASTLPMPFLLLQNYPNPFNPSTTIRFTLPAAGQARLSVYNTLGEEVANLINADLRAGSHEVRFDASHLATGVYISRLTAGGKNQTRKLMLVR
jgi:uncharacterized delta-60 repeat protein